MATDPAPGIQSEEGLEMRFDEIFNALTEMEKNLEEQMRILEEIRDAPDKAAP